VLLHESELHVYTSDAIAVEEVIINIPNTIIERYFFRYIPPLNLLEIFTILPYDSKNSLMIIG
jgi:hypothetical protein